MKRWFRGENELFSRKSVFLFSLSLRFSGNLRIIGIEGWSPLTPPSYRAVPAEKGKTGAVLLFPSAGYYSGMHTSIYLEIMFGLQYNVLQKGRKCVSTSHSQKRMILYYPVNEINTPNGCDDS